MAGGEKHSGHGKDMGDALCDKVVEAGSYDRGRELKIAVVDGPFLEHGAKLLGENRELGHCRGRARAVAAYHHAVFGGDGVAGIFGVPRAFGVPGAIGVLVGTGCGVCLTHILPPCSLACLALLDLAYMVGRCVCRGGLDEWVRTNAWPAACAARHVVAAGSWPGVGARYGSAAPGSISPCRQVRRPFGCQ